MRPAILTLIAGFFFLSFAANAQDDLMSLLGEEEPPKEYIKNAFKSTRVITTQSMEFVAPGVLDFRILHRFGPFSDGAKEAWGLDQANMRLGLDYGITDRLTIGIGRSNLLNELDGFIKYRPIWQGKGEGAMPFSLILISGVTQKQPKDRNPEYYTSRLAFYHQAILGKKFSEYFTLQVMPSLVHLNIVDSTRYDHDLGYIGVGGRVKLSRSISLTAEYFHKVVGEQSNLYQNPLSIGFDIETGGHVFQLHFSNSQNLNERTYLTETQGKWKDGDIHFGFNISRVFTLSKPKSFRK
jgi:hypothetical protein